MKPSLVAVKDYYASSHGAGGALGKRSNRRVISSQGSPEVSQNHHCDVGVGIGRERRLDVRLTGRELGPTEGNEVLVPVERLEPMK